MQTIHSAYPNGKTIVEVGLDELRRISDDHAARQENEQTFNEARGREAARLQVTLRAVSEADLRTAARTREVLDAMERLAADLQERSERISHLVESFENLAEKRFAGVHEEVGHQSSTLRASLEELTRSEERHHEALVAQVRGFQGAVSAQTAEARQAVFGQVERSQVQVSQELRTVRDEMIRLLDAHANQSDAAFAALRGDVEVVKFLVMDLIKDRIGRADPKARPI